MPSPTEILELLEEITETPELQSNLDLLLFDMHIVDSMRTVELLLAVSHRFGIEISPAEFDRDNWATPAKFIQDIQRRGAALQ